jgi:catechol 2,3-dioxygenase-like lactoylglutathione lyase family enzyme
MLTRPGREEESMEREVSRILKDYETGRVTRRQVVTRLALLGAAAAGAGGTSSGEPGPGPTFEASGLNHIALGVTDVERSRDFYTKHLGLRVARESLPGSCFLDCGPHFVALFRARRPGMDHYCYSVPGYDQQEAARKLRAQNIEPRLAGNRIYFPDPDGIEVQLAAPGHRA